MYFDNSTMDDEPEFDLDFSRVGSNLSLFSRLPPQECWQRHGIVERQTVANDISWQQTLMVLTNKDILFARPETDIIVDRLRLKDVKFARRVDQGTLLELKEKKKSKHKNMNVKFSTSFQNGPVIEVQDGTKETFAFEIKAVLSGQERSYFARVLTSEQREGWVKEIEAAVMNSNSSVSNDDHLLFQYQRRLRYAWNSKIARSIIAFAILCDFITNIVTSEFLFPEGTDSYRAFNAIGRILDFFFGFELLLACAANWRTWWGAPFFRGVWNIYHLGTVIFQVGAYLFMPQIEHFKCVRMLRIFHVVRMFKVFAPFRIILKALRQGDGPTSVHTLQSLSVPESIFNRNSAYLNVNDFKSRFSPYPHPPLSHTGAYTQQTKQRWCLSNSAGAL